MSGQLRSIVEHRILDVGWKRELCKKTDGPILNIYMSYDMVLCKELPFGGCDDCTCVKTFSGNTLYTSVLWNEFMLGHDWPDRGNANRVYEHSHSPGGSTGSKVWYLWLPCCSGALLVASTVYLVCCGLFSANTHADHFNSYSSRWTHFIQLPRWFWPMTLAQCLCSQMPFPMSVEWVIGIK